MAIKFLCDEHRAMLTDHPVQAINIWQDSFDRGSVLYEEKRWQQALSFLGSAYETACIIMISKALDQNSACELLTTSAVLLANTCVMLGNEADSRKIYNLAIDQLEQQTAHSMQERLCINQYIAHLYRNIRRLECTAEKTGITAGSTMQLINATMH